MGPMHRLLPALFALFALPVVIFLAFAMPMFGNVDEPNHLMRAEMIVGGQWLGQRPEPGQSGGKVDTGLLLLLQSYEPMLRGEETVLTGARVQAGRAVPWTGDRVFIHIPNTAIYPPVFYLPMAAALAYGQAEAWPVQDTVTLARLVNGLLSVAAGALALHLARAGRWMLFATLLLPMSLAQFAAASQDALLLSCSALMLALLSRPLGEDRPATWPEFAAAALLVAALSAARPTHLAFALLLPLIAPGPLGRLPRPAVGALGAGAVVAAVLAWIALTVAWVHVQQLSAGGVLPDVGAQLRHVLERPFAFPAALWNTLDGGKWWGTLVMLLGWLGWAQMNMPVPGWYLSAALPVLGLALVADAVGAGRPRPRAALALLAAAAVNAVGIYFVQYLSFSAVGAASVEGVQGRYFLPVLGMAGLLAAAAGIPEGRRGRAVCALAAVPVLLLPLLGMAAVMRTVIGRVFLG